MKSQPVHKSLIQRLILALVFGIILSDETEVVQ